MRIDVAKLPYTKSFEMSENVVFDKETYARNYPLMEVLSCDAKVKTQRFEEFIYVTISIKAKVVLNCAYTLKDFETTISGVDELHFAPDNDEDEDCITYKGNIIELDPYIYNLLSASVPLSPKSPNAKAPESGKGYRILSDDEYFKEKEECGNSQFDALKDLDL